MPAPEVVSHTVDEEHSFGDDNINWAEGFCGAIKTIPLISIDVVFGICEILGVAQLVNLKHKHVYLFLV